MEISNLGKYIELFLGCVVSILNYENIDLPPTSVPIILTRFICIRYCRITIDFDSKEQTWCRWVRLDPIDKINIPPCVNQTDPKYNNKALKVIFSQQKNWQCLTRFYIYKEDTRTPKPSEMEEFFTQKNEKNEKYFSKYLVEETFPRPQYHVFIPKHSPFVDGTSELNDVLKENQLAQIIILEPATLYSVTFVRKKLVFSIEGTIINNMLLCCKYCDKYNRTFHKHDSTLFLRHLEKAFESFDKNWTAVGLHVIITKTDHFNEEVFIPAQKTTRLSEIHKLKYKSDHFLLTLLQRTFLDNSSINLVTKYEEGDLFFDYPNCNYGKCHRWDMIFPVINAISELDVILFKGIKAFTFLSCSNRQKKLSSLEVLMHAFDLTTWIGLAITWVLSSIFLACVVSPKRQKVSKVTAFCFPFEMLLEHGNSTAQNIQKDFHLYMILLPLILSCVVISGAFKGDNMTTIISPMEPIRFKHFETLFKYNFTFFSNMMIYSKISTSFYLTEHSYAERLTLKSSRSVENLASNKTLKLLRSQNFVTKFASNLLLNKYKKNHICRNFAYLGWSDELREIKSKVGQKYGQYQWDMGVENVVSFPIGWKLNQLQDPNLRKWLKRLGETGIVSKLIEFEESGRQLVEQNYGRKNNYSAMGNRKVSPLQLKGNISTIFIWFSILLIVMGMPFGIECFLGYRKLIFKMIYWILITCNKALVKFSTAIKFRICPFPGSRVRLNRKKNSNKLANLDVIPSTI